MKVSTDSLIVKLYDKTVGYLSLDQKHNVYFEYEETFKKTALEISPIKLPLATTSIYTNNDDRFFEGLAGVFFDSLPDRFGNEVIKRYYAQKGINEYQLNPIQKLAYIGQSGMGALEYIPSEPTPFLKESLEIKSLVDDARAIIQGDISVAIPELISSGGSAGGARAKAVIQWNKKTNSVISGRLAHKEGFEEYIIKFDGVGKEYVPAEYGKVEYIYMKIAKELGLNVADVSIFHERDFSHLLIKHFDRKGDKKIHMHSLCGLTHSNFNIPGSYSYEEYLRVVEYLTKDKTQLQNAFVHMLYNVITCNQDDHTKNFSFLMDEMGIWRCAPLYDITYNKGNDYTAHHQLSINGKRDNFTLEDIKSVSRMFSIATDAEVEELVKQMKQYFITSFAEEAKKLDISQNKIDKVLQNSRF
ncbi:type II toxin-antitoxin system HipA family toxin [Sulfurimonas sp.]|uniref:type II toxin-antitoxin system HipA family toxin n=1 Tax=Sulfurimonas sp. TaxID=2022749 RepID=UPI003D0F1AC0